ncbi:MAG: polysaccharide biosynthesis protein [Thermotogaceae bacterium]|nr:polysaccharide biosynthesis protein [Thermotogaceae bacterium]
MTNYLNEKVVIVTGAGGSIGSELVRQIARVRPKKVILLGKGENSIYKIDEELGMEFPDVEKERIIGDVSDEVWMEDVFERAKPDIVFHAAAHKHVHLMEENPYEAFRVNVLGTKILAELCCKYGVERFIFISTDKAVNPTSIMGLSKRLSELYLIYGIDGSQCSTKFAIVRFGNVLGSRGSVIPKFREQIKRGGPVTVTDPRMRRFFMTIPEAVSLVLQAGAYSSGKDLFVLDMGDQISIDELARTLITLSGFVPDQDIKIVYTGMRPGEKLYEELFYSYEIVENTQHPKVMKAVSKREFKGVKEVIDRITSLIKSGNWQGIIKEAKKIVPEYGGWNHVDGNKRYS